MAVTDSSLEQTNPFHQVMSNNIWFKYVNCKLNKDGFLNVQSVTGFIAYTKMTIATYKFYRVNRP